MNGNASRWIIGILTILLVGVFGWALSTVTATQQRVAMLEERTLQQQSLIESRNAQLDRLEQKVDFVIQNMAAFKANIK